MTAALALSAVELWIAAAWPIRESCRDGWWHTALGYSLAMGLSAWTLIRLATIA
jgi:hypothetical protein